MKKMKALAIGVLLVCAAMLPAISVVSAQELQITDTEGNTLTQAIKDETLRVLISFGGAPVAGADVMFALPSTAMPVHVQTDGSGIAEYLPLITGTLRITARATIQGVLYEATPVEILVEEVEPTPDTTPPYTSNHNPAKGATGVSRGTNIVVHVKDDGIGVDQSTIVMTVEGAVVTPDITGSPADYTLTYDPPTDFAYSQVVDVTIDADDLNTTPNVMVQDAYSFTIESKPYIPPTPDTTRPTVTSVSPADGATDVSITPTISATFSERMNKASAEGAFSVDGVTGTFSWTGNTMAFTPSANLSYGTTYNVTISTGARDSAGNYMANDYTWSFTTTSVPDVTAPTIISVSPADGATDVPVTTTLIATFSEAMNETSAQAAFSVDDVAGTFNWTGNTMTFMPDANLTYNTTYNVTIGTGAQDLAGNSMTSDYTWSFTTTSVPDITAPTIISVSPEDGATNVPVATTLSAIFSEAMNETSAEAAFSVDDVAGTFSWTGNTMTFTPDANLAYNTVYTVTVGTSAQDLAGNTMASEYTWSFTTTSVPDVTAPTITSVWPADGAANVPVTTTLSATFSEAMNKASAEAAFSVDDVAGTFSWAGNTMAFTPDANLAYNTVYTVTIGTGAQDLAGNSMVSDYTWSFTTTSVPDVTPPTITSVWPADGATNVPVTTTLSATFSEAMNKASAEAAFSVDDVAGTFSWAGNTMAFTPSVNLAYNTAYTVTIGTGAQDLAGNPMASDYTWSFTTTSVPDVTPPTIISVWPADGAANVPVTTTLIAIFSEAMNKASAEAAFSVDSVAGTFSWAGNTMTFTPSVNLAYLNTAYTVTIGTGAQDLAGNSMASAYTWSFTTESAYDVELTVDEEEKPTVAGLNVTYFLTVNNIGNLADSYTLSIDNPDNATVANLNTYTIANLVPGTVADVSLNVTNATAGTFRVNVTVVSEYDPANATDSVHTTTTVGPSQTSTINESTEINALDIADTIVTINVTGPVNVTIGKYTANPGTAFAADTGKYIDVRIDNVTNVDNMTIKQFYTDAEFDVSMNESSLRMYWWDGAAWTVCSNTGVNTTDQDGYSGYIWAFINDSTIPSLSDLTGTPFGSAGPVPPSVTVISPNGGEDWKVGSSYAIRWTATNGSRPLATNPITIQYSTNNGVTYTIIKTNEANDGTYTWTIPSTTSTACLVKVIAEDITGMEGFDVSDAKFTISYAAAGGGGGGPAAAPYDSDGDGISDRDEMFAGTDPNDPCDPNPECAACLAIRPPTPTPTAVVTPTPAVTPTLPPAVMPTATPTPAPPFPVVPMYVIFVIVAAVIIVAVAYAVLRRRKS